MEANTGNHQSSNDEKKKRKRLKKLQADIRQQIEFYFSDANLRKDRFLKQEIAKSGDGYLHIATLATFNRIRKMTEDPVLIAKSLETSEIIEVSEDKTKIRRKKPLEEPRYNIDDVTVYVENLPHNVDHDMLRKAFSTCGSIAYISLPRYKTTGDPKRFAFIEFTTPKEAAKACKLLNNPPRSKPDADGHFPTTRKGRLILPEQPVNLRQLPEARPPAKRGDDDTLTKRKREASETEVISSDPEKDRASKKKKAATKKGEPPVGGDDKVMPGQKRKRAVGGATGAGEEEEPTDKKAKRKKEAPLEKREQDGQTDSRKRKHSGGEDSGHAHERSSQSEVRSRKSDRSDAGAKVGKPDTRLKGERSELKGERSDAAAKSGRPDAGAKGERSAKEKKRVGGSEAHKRKREDSTGSVDSSKVKRSTLERSDKKDDGKVKKAKKAESEVEEGDSGDKRKRRKNRSRKHKKEEDESANMLQLRVISKKDWMSLREEYLAIQKASRQQMKQALRDQRKKVKTEQVGERRKGEKVQQQETETKLKSAEPEFVSGVVLKISSNKPFASRKDLREQLQEISPVAYIELKDGDTGGFIRLKSAEGAKAVLGKASKINNDSGHVEMNLLSGQAESEYWEKLKADRLTKLSSKTRKQKKRGVARILNKSEKVLGSGKPKKSHIVFNGD